MLRSPSRPLRIEKSKLAIEDMPAEASLARAVENSIEHQSDIIERRLMNQSIEPHECMKQIKKCVYVFDHQLSSIHCMASSVVGVLRGFELAEQRRYPPGNTLRLNSNV